MLRLVHESRELKKKKRRKQEGKYSGYFWQDSYNTGLTTRQKKKAV